jgi:hypothetical protein
MRLRCEVGLGRLNQDFKGSGSTEQVTSALRLAVVLACSVLGAWCSVLLHLVLGPVTLRAPRGRSPYHIVADCWD